VATIIDITEPNSSGINLDFIMIILRNPGQEERILTSAAATTAATTATTAAATAAAAVRLRARPIVGCGAGSAALAASHALSASLGRDGFPAPGLHVSKGARVA
jgi:hypothetical protein